MPEYLTLSDSQPNTHVPVFLRDSHLGSTQISRLSFGIQVDSDQREHEVVRKEAKARITGAELMTLFPWMSMEDPFNGIYIDFSEPDVFAANWGGPTTTLELRERLAPFMIGDQIDRIERVERALTEAIALHTIQQSHLAYHPNLCTGRGFYIEQGTSGNYEMSLISDKIQFPRSLGDVIKDIKRITTAGSRERREAILNVLTGLTGVFGLIEGIGTLNPPIIHKDLKPDSIHKNGASEQFLVLDFNNAAVGEDIANETGAICSIKNAAPEQVIIDGKASPLTDRYSLTLLLAEILTCDHPQNRTSDGTADIQTIGHQLASNIATFVPELEKLLITNLGLREQQAKAVATKLRTGANYFPQNRSCSATQVLELAIKIIQNRNSRL